MKHCCLYDWEVTYAIREIQNIHFHTKIYNCYEISDFTKSLLNLCNYGHQLTLQLDEAIDILSPTLTVAYISLIISQYPVTYIHHCNLSSQSKNLFKNLFQK